MRSVYTFDRVSLLDDARPAPDEAVDADSTAPADGDASAGDDRPPELAIAV
jgi:hypothetical protein